MGFCSIYLFICLSIYLFSFAPAVKLGEEWGMSGVGGNGVGETPFVAPFISLILCLQKDLITESWES